ncbi:hypothetical protein C8J57DRAFT_1260134 [Mycena rebaudengoi]|nr:hypothetical protein C8J57DRAFT_1260134 [Mycena rebaudengoi]
MSKSTCRPRPAPSRRNAPPPPVCPMPFHKEWRPTRPCPSPQSMHVGVGGRTVERRVTLTQNGSRTFDPHKYTRSPSGPAFTNTARRSICVRGDVLVRWRGEVVRKLKEGNPACLLRGRPGAMPGQGEVPHRPVHAQGCAKSRSRRRRCPAGRGAEKNNKGGEKNEWWKTRSVRGVAPSVVYRGIAYCGVVVPYCGVGKILRLETVLRLGLGPRDVVLEHTDLRRRAVRYQSSRAECAAVQARQHYAPCAHREATKFAGSTEHRINLRTAALRGAKVLREHGNTKRWWDPEYRILTTAVDRDGRMTLREILILNKKGSGSGTPAGKWWR